MDRKKFPAQLYDQKQKRTASQNRNQRVCLVDRLGRGTARSGFKCHLVSGTGRIPQGREKDVREKKGRRHVTRALGKARERERHANVKGGVREEQRTSGSCTRSMLIGRPAVTQTPSLLERSPSVWWAAGRLCVVFPAQRLGLRYTRGCGIALPYTLNNEAVASGPRNTVVFNRDFQTGRRPPFFPLRWIGRDEGGGRGGGAF